MYTVKNNRNFTDPVMGNCDKKSTVNREFTGKWPYILYINGQFTVLLQIFRKFTGNKKRGISQQQIFRGIYRKSCKIRSIAREFTENLQKNSKLAVNI